MLSLQGLPGRKHHAADGGLGNDGPTQAVHILLEVLESNRSLMSSDYDCWIVHNISRQLMKPGPSPSQTNLATVMVFTSPMDGGGLQQRSPDRDRILFAGASPA